MGLEDDLRRVEEYVAEARRMVQRQKGLIIRVQAAGVSTWDAQEYSGYLIQFAAIGGTPGPPSGKHRSTANIVMLVTVVTRQDAQNVCL